MQFTALSKFVARFFSAIVVLAIISLPTLYRPQTLLAASGGLTPGKPTNFKTVTGPGAGQITLYWDEVAYSDRYAVAYGTESNKYVYGADNIGGASSRSYTVKQLAPNTRYYFRLAAAHGGSSSPFSEEVTASTGAIAESTQAVVIPKAQTASMPVTKMTNITGPVGAEQLWAKSGPKVGEVTLFWRNANSANNYHLVYAEFGKPASFGALSLGKISQFTVSKLAPGKKYQFALVALMDNRPLYTTEYTSAQSYTPSIEVVSTTREALIQPQPKGMPAEEDDVVETPIGQPVEVEDIDEENGDVQGIDNQTLDEETDDTQEVGY